MLSGAGLVMLAPLLLVIAAAVLIANGRPVLFVQARSGRGGKVFRLVKIRTMTDERTPDGAPLPDVERVTRIGKLMRRLRIDELPQLWNVLVGDMSLVGPRPLLPASITNAAEAGNKRGAVRPGITGWAQINGNTLLSEQDKIAFDLWYVDHKSLGLDLMIIGRTLLVVLFGERLDATAIRRVHARSPYRGG